MKSGSVTHPPVVLMLAPAVPGEEELAQATEAGASTFLLKPVTPSTLFDAIVSIFAPRQQQEKSMTSNGAERARPLEGARVLLAEDNEINQQIAVELLTAHGMDVVVAENGREAVEKLIREEPAATTWC